MRNKIEAALLAAVLLASPGLSHAQDPEEGAVDLAPEPAAEESHSDRAMGEPDSFEPERSSRDPGAAPAPGKLRVFAGARLGIGGGFRPKGEDYLYLASPTGGFQLGADYVLLKYFALGAETRFSWMTLKREDFSFMIWDLVLKPRGVYKLDDLPLELYAALPVGLSLGVPEGENNTGKPSATLGIFAGGTYFLTDHWAVNAELGWLWTWLHWENKVPANPINGQPGSTTERKFRLGQLTMLAVNAVYAF